MKRDSISWPTWKSSCSFIVSLRPWSCLCFRLIVYLQRDASVVIDEVLLLLFDQRDSLLRTRLTTGKTVDDGDDENYCIIISNSFEKKKWGRDERLLRRKRRTSSLENSLSSCSFASCSWSKRMKNISSTRVFHHQSSSSSFSSWMNPKKDSWFTTTSLYEERKEIYEDEKVWPKTSQDSTSSQVISDLLKFRVVILFYHSRHFMSCCPLLSFPFVILIKMQLITLPWPQ